MAPDPLVLSLSSSPTVMASDLEKKAKEAFIDDHFELAVSLYTEAIKISPKNAELYADRAQANIKSNNFTGIIRDFLCLCFFFLFPRVMCEISWC